MFYVNTGTRRAGEMSAYSVFNEGVEAYVSFSFSFFFACFTDYHSGPTGSRVPRRWNTSRGSLGGRFIDLPSAFAFSSLYLQPCLCCLLFAPHAMQLPHVYRN